jgi:hypothetical protein
MSRALLDRRYSPQGWFADSLALWVSTSSALLGCGVDSDEGLDFALDEPAEAAGPRYTAWPKWGGASLNLKDIAPIASSAKTPLTPENFMLRHEDDRLSVTLVKLKRLPELEGLKKVPTGKYHMVFHGHERLEERIEFLVK